VLWPAPDGFPGRLCSSTMPQRAAVLQSSTLNPT
jgi:hypothetical protein